jgi:hypothetical protein
MQGAEERSEAGRRRTIESLDSRRRLLRRLKVDKAKALQNGKT